MVRDVLNAGAYGVLLGALYALVAVGIVLIFRATKTVNFAHGHFALLGGFVFLEFSVIRAQPPIIGLALAFATVAIVSLVWGRIVESMRRGGDDLVPLVASIGVFVMLDGVVLNQWGSRQPYVVPALLPRTDVHIGFLTIDSTMLWIGLAAAILFVGLGFIFTRTDLGLRVRAAVQNRDAAELLGIPTRRLALGAWIVGSLLGVVALLLFVPRSFLSNTTMTSLTIRGFAASSVGGFESLIGAAIGGLGLGIAEALAGRFIGSGLQSVVALLVVVVMIFSSPKGLFVARGERA